MAGYFQNPYNMDGGGDMLDLMDTSGMNQGNMGATQSLDEIVDGNAKAMRRGSMPVHYQDGQQQLTDPRRASLMNFGSTSPGSPMDGFQQYDNTKTPMDRSNTYPRPGGNMQARRQSSNNLMLDTFSNHSSPFPQMQIDANGFASPMTGPNSAVDMNMANMFANANMAASMDMSEQALNNALVNSSNNLMFGQDQFDSPVLHSPMGPIFPDASMHNTPQLRKNLSVATSDPQGNLTPDLHSSRTGSHQSQDTGNGRLTTPRTTSHSSTPQNPSFRPAPQTFNSQMSQMSQHSIHSQQTQQDAAPQMPQVATGGHNVTQIKVPWDTPPGGFPSTMHGRPHMEGQYKNAYSSTGFDMIGVLMRVATRPNPQINIGAVDLSCAFVVCDAEKDDNPIVYCSDNFERLTGYNRHEILGRNCRFLQSPDGRVKPGIKRKYVDDDSVLYLKNMITTRKEAQISLINYRRGGQPFMNLLTMIPIPWEDAQTKFFVGFQVDLVEQPSSVTNKNPDGSYSINYQRGLSMPRYIAPDQRSQLDLGQSISREEVSNVLSTFGTQGDSEFTRRMWDKILLENTDDVVHVLSLKGLFLYLSPSCRTVLEYEAQELVGAALSSVCHPSDIVPVTREFKDTSNNVSVNVVFRIRRKHSGYMWFEGHGTLHTEQGKGRKCIILVGRERPVYSLSKTEIRESGGIGENELWTKMSTSGMFLFVSSNVRQLLDRQPDELIGTSIQVLMRHDSKQEFGRILSMARTGKKASVKHEMMNKRGQTLQAFTTIYPGDASEGQKPTFLVAQTRMLKFSRGNTSANQRQALLAMTDQSSAASGYQPSPAHVQSVQQSSGQETPVSHMSASQFISSDGAAATCAGHDGLRVGKQDAKLAAEENLFDELKTTRSTSWQYELRQMEKCNRLLAEEVQSLLAAKKKRKRRKGAGQLQKDCANCHTRTTPEWRRGPSGNRDLCNSCGLRWAKQQGRVSPRTSSQHSASNKGSKASASPLHTTMNQDSSSSPQITSNLDSTVMNTGGLPHKVEKGADPD